MSENNKMTVAKDTVIYMLAKAVEGVIGFATLSAYSHFFSEETYGRYDLVNKSVTILGPICLLWLQHGATRYVNTYEAKNDAKSFYSTVFMAWAAVSAAILLLGTAGLSLLTGVFAQSPPVASFLSTFRPSWLWLALFCILAFGAGQLVLAIAGAKRRISLTLSLSLFSATMKLLIPLALTHRLGPAVDWILIANLICDCSIAIYGSIRLKLWQQISISAYSKPVLLLLFSFGIPLIGNFITTTVLNNSDRFLIAAFSGTGETGIYGANYAIAATIVTMLTFAAARGSYPNILKAWSVNDKALTIDLISQAVRLFLLLALPAVVGLSALSPRVSMLLDAAYRDGYVVIPWVSFGLLFLGLTEYSNKYWELSANTKIIFRNSAISGVFNILLNVLFLRHFGYITAAVSTFLGFLLYFLLSKLESRKYIKWTLPWQSYARILSAAAVMGAAVLVLSRVLPMTWLWLPVPIAVGVCVYGGILCVSGELAPELRFIKNRLKRKA